MKRVKKEVWETDKGASLIERRGPGDFVVYVCGATTEQLAELRDACEDAIRREQVLANVHGPCNGMAAEVTEAAMSC
jgi:hypothetical protein